MRTHNEETGPPIIDHNDTGTLRPGYTGLSAMGASLDENLSPVFKVIDLRGPSFPTCCA